MITLDDEGYPTDEYLQFIKDYKPEVIPFRDFLDILQNAWRYSGFGFKLHRKYNGIQKLELHTVGRPGNEAIIEAILSNIYLTHFSMKYVKWITGGHYYFLINLKQ